MVRLRDRVAMSDDVRKHPLVAEKQTTINIFKKILKFDLSIEMDGK